MEKHVKPHSPRNYRTIIIFTVLFVLIGISVFLYIFSRTYVKAWRLGIETTPATFDSIIERAYPVLIGMFISAVLIAVVSLSFQTITQSRLLTPSMIGFDSIFIATQTIIIFSFGAVSDIFSNPYINFIFSSGIMVILSMIMYGFILRKGRNNIIFLLMFGLVVSGILNNTSNYLQIIMDNNDYYRVQAAVSVTVNNMNTDIIFIALPIILCISMFIIFRHRIYNVMSLGAQQAKSLGVNYGRELNINLVLIAVGMSVTTALIGPLTFLGLLAVNSARELLKTHKHFPLFIASALLAAITLIFGQAIVEYLEGAVPVTAIINLVGCSYTFYLIYKQNRV